MEWLKRPEGRFGEKLAEGFLARHGYKILARRYLCCFGELDIVAQDKEAIVFVEVKQRSSSEFGMPYEAIDKRKREHIIKSAISFIKKYALENYDLRFDIVSILNEENEEIKIELIKDAFEVE